MNIISVDYKLREGDELFAQTLEQETSQKWETYSVISNFKQRSIFYILKRYSTYCIVGWRLFCKRKSIDNLVAWQQFYGIFFAFFCHLFHVKKVTNLYILTLIYKRKSCFLGKIYEWFMKYAIDDKYVDVIVCFSESEIETYKSIFNVNPSKYHFLLVAKEKLPEFDISPAPDKYLFTAGFSHRDFDFLIEALKDTPYKLIIADDRVKDPNVDNITILRGCYGDEMRKIIGNCYVFINPLKDKTISAGHLMAITAMQLHKPVICTESEGMRPYVINGKTGYFIDNTKDNLLKVLDEIYNDPQLYQKMSDFAYEFAKEQFSWKRLAKDIAKIGREGHLL